MKQFFKSGIVTQVHYIPVFVHPYYKKKYKNKKKYLNSINFYNSALSIPLFYDLSDKEQRYVINKVKKFIG